MRSTRRKLTPEQRESLRQLVTELLRASWRASHHPNGEFWISESSYAEAFGAIHGAAAIGYGSLDGHCGENLRELFNEWCDDLLIEFGVQSAIERRNAEVRRKVAGLRL